MYLVGLGLVFMAMKYLEFGPVALWDWWIVLSPFALAIAWWAWADSSGYTKRKAMEIEDAKVKARHDANRAAIGTLNTKSKKR